MQNSSITMNTALKEYNRIFREINLIYQETAQSLGLSHSAFDIYYAICQLGDGCRQKDIADIPSFPNRPSTPPFIRWKKTD